MPIEIYQLGVGSRSQRLPLSLACSPAKSKRFFMTMWCLAVRAAREDGVVVRRQKRETGTSQRLLDAAGTGERQRDGENARQRDFSLSLSGALSCGCSLAIAASLIM